MSATCAFGHNMRRRLGYWVRLSRASCEMGASTRGGRSSVACVTRGCRVKRHFGLDRDSASPGLSTTHNP